MKACIICSHPKELEKFYAHPEMADGHSNKCIECYKEYEKERRLNPVVRESKRAYEQGRQQTPKRRLAQQRYQIARRLRNPEKHQARTAIGNALRDGRLERKPCEECGSMEVQAHHDDYSKPLDVRWLCFRHHREIAHNQIVGELA